GAPVSIPNPTAVVIPPARPADAPQPEVAIAAPRPAPAARFGEPQWVKVFKTEIGRAVDLDELLGGNPIVPDERNQTPETPWKLLQFDAKRPTKGSSQLANRSQSGSGSHAVVRRYEFFTYIGALNPDGSARCANVDAAGECTEPAAGELGDFIGAQMAAQNVANVTVPIISWPTPSNIVYGTALGATELDATANANGAVVAGTFRYTPAEGTVISAGGAIPLSVLFTPNDPAQYGEGTASVSIIVEQATPAISWPTPSDQVVGPFI